MSTSTDSTTSAVRATSAAGVRPFRLRRLAGIAVVTLVTFAALPLFAAPALAHNVVASTSPSDGADLERMPAAVTLEFDQKVLELGTAVRVAGPDGEIQTGDPEIDGGEVVQRLRADAPAGEYTVTWRVTSVDGHPISGTFGFEAERPRATATATSRPAASDAPTASTSPSATPVAAESDREGTNWTAILLWGLAGAIAGTAIVVVNRRRSRSTGA